MRERGRLLLWGGLVSPLLMIVAGGLLSWLRLRGAPDWWGPQPWGRVVWAPVVAGASLGVTTLAAKLWPAFGRRLKQSGTSVNSEVLAQVGYPVMLVVVAGAALGEEILFRGGVQPWLGPVLAAFLFGFSHGGWRWREMWAYVLAASFSGLLFGWYLDWAGTIWAPVVAHLLHNVTAVLLLGKKVDVSWKGIRVVPEPVEQPADEADLGEGAPPLASSEVENEREA